VWRKPLGNDPAFPNSTTPTGTENYGGSVITAGGLVFIAAAKDGKIRAFNKRNGELLWEATLPVPAYATPSVFEINGKQYLVIACGGGKLNTRSGDSYVAFALPGKKLIFVDELWYYYEAFLASHTCTFLTLVSI
jgi:quinoprotein glucose dehydrogenase